MQSNEGFFYKMISHNILIAYIIGVNIISYVLMCYDKYRSKKGGWRIMEKMLFVVALALGATGVYLGMKAPLYHKASKQKFKIGIPVLIMLNALLACFLFTGKFEEILADIYMF